jgi:hypothetical protein
MAGRRGISEPFWAMKAEFFLAEQRMQRVGYREMLPEWNSARLAHLDEARTCGFLDDFAVSFIAVTGGNH